MKKTTNTSNLTVEEKETTLPSDVSLREDAILAFWKEHNIFQKSLVKPAGTDPKGNFVFFDGPPFATGLPHYGHILAGTMKDAIPRFWTMNGYRVDRRWGWDCHGLPVENLIEKKLGLSTKRDIEDYGIKNFNESARNSVLEYADDWRKIVPRLGRFVDMENDYKTMDSSYTESVWWIFKQLHEKGLVFEGFKSMHLCPRCGTTLSNFEVNQGYKDIKDIAVTVKLPLLNTAGEMTDTSLLVWTTTPWTLPGNLAVAVNQDFAYAKVSVEVEGKVEYLILAQDRLDQIKDLSYTKVSKLRGTELIGLRYQPPFSYLAEQVTEGLENAWRIYHADFVVIGEEGTGAVHIAPAFGEDDMNLARDNNIPIIHHVDELGHFKNFVTELAGQLVKPKDDESAGVSHLDADIQIIKALKTQGVLVKKENITHSYPHCWRCDTPLINYATTSWFVDVPKIKEALVTANQAVSWVPAHVGTNRFGKWLEGARDWAVSRQRYWGAPLPIWKNAETGEHKVIGSLAELQTFVPKSRNRYFIVRHGESLFNTLNLLNVDLSVENGLTDLGRQQVDELAKKISAEKIDLIIYSPMQRTRETAERLADNLSLTKDQLKSDDRLLEMGFGVFEGKTGEEYLAFFGDGLGRMTKRPDGGENWTDVKRRVGDFLYETEESYQAKNILLIAHGGTLQMLQSASRGETREVTALKAEQNVYDLANAELRELSFTPMPHNEDYELDFHRPYIDELALFEDGVKLGRIPDVFDCWFESGSMPYGQHHYPFEKTDSFLSQNFPAQFISEGLDQTRGWFYSMLVLGVALFGRAPFEQVVVNGLVRAEDGRKMSKSLNNYPDPMELVNRQGADALRFYLLSSPTVRAEDLNFSEKEVQEIQRKNIGRLHNVLQMYEMYADGVPADNQSDQVLDRWILARQSEMIKDVTAGYHSYELDKAARPIADFIDDLSVWYLRRSRDRLKGEAVTDRVQALATLRYVLQNLSLVMAPVMPFYADYLWLATRTEGDAESVHLAKWPEPERSDEALLVAMKQAREVVTSALEARTKAGIKVRQPIASVAGPLLASELQSVVLDEVNAKQYVVVEMGVGIDNILTPELLAEGAVRELIRAIQEQRKSAGLLPTDEVVLTIETDTLGQFAVENHRHFLVRTVGAKKIDFAYGGKVLVSVGDYRFGFAIEKI